MAEAGFLEEIARRHPEADGKPVIVANCQAGWQTMIMAATRPEIPVLSCCWIAVVVLGWRSRSQSDALSRRTLGGTWMTALAGDLGNGISTAPTWWPISNR